MVPDFFYPKNEIKGLADDNMPDCEDLQYEVKKLIETDLGKLDNKIVNNRTINSKFDILTGKFIS